MPSKLPLHYLHAGLPAGSALVDSTLKPLLEKMTWYNSKGTAPKFTVRVNHRPETIYLPRLIWALEHERRRAEHGELAWSELSNAIYSQDWIKVVSILKPLPKLRFIDGDRLNCQIENIVPVGGGYFPRPTGHSSLAGQSPEPKAMTAGARPEAQDEVLEGSTEPSSDPSGILDALAGVPAPEKNPASPVKG